MGIYANRFRLLKAITVQSGCGLIFVNKPLSWYPRPDLLEPIYLEAKRVKRSHGAALKWLSTPCMQLDGRFPIRMAESEAEADELSI